MTRRPQVEASRRRRDKYRTPRRAVGGRSEFPENRLLPGQQAVIVKKLPRVALATEDDNHRLDAGLQVQAGVRLQQTLKPRPEDVVVLVI